MVCSHLLKAIAGLVADGRQVVNRAQNEAVNYKRSVKLQFATQCVSLLMSTVVHSLNDLADCDSLVCCYEWGWSSLLAHVVSRILHLL